MATRNLTPKAIAAIEDKFSDAWTRVCDADMGLENASGALTTVIVAASRDDTPMTLHHARSILALVRTAIDKARHNLGKTEPFLREGLGEAAGREDREG